MTYGTFFFIIFDVNLYVVSTKFYDGLAYQGGAIYISGDSSIILLKSEFKNNVARLYGGAIFGAGFSLLRIG